MAFPSLASVTEFETSGSTASVAMPATVEADDLLLIFFSTDGGGGLVDTTSEWTLLTTATRSSFVRGSIFAKIAEGDEGGSTVLFDMTGSNEYLTAQTFRFLSGSWEGSIDGGISFALAGDPGTTSTHNPPNLDTGWGTEDVLWIVFVAGSSYTGVSSPPTDFGNVLHTNPTSSTSESSVSTCRQELTAGELNPDSISMNNSSSGRCWLVAVKPGEPIDPRAGDRPIDLRGGAWPVEIDLRSK